MKDDKLAALLQYTKPSEELSPDFTELLMRKIALQKSVLELQTERQLMRSISVIFITLMALGAFAFGGYIMLSSPAVDQFLVSNGMSLDALQQNIHITIGVIVSTVVVLQFNNLLITLRMLVKAR